MTTVAIRYASGGRGEEGVFQLVGDIIIELMTRSFQSTPLSVDFDKNASNLQDPNSKHFAERRKIDIDIGDVHIRLASVLRFFLALTFGLRIVGLGPQSVVICFKLDEAISFSRIVSLAMRPCGYPVIAMWHCPVLRILCWRSCAGSNSLAFFLRPSPPRKYLV